MVLSELDDCYDTPHFDPSKNHDGDFSAHISLLDINCKVAHLIH
jgi:hypothetical protein